MRLLVGGSDGPLREGMTWEVRAALLDDAGRPLCEAPVSMQLEVLDEDDAVLQAAGAMTRADEDSGTATGGAASTLTDSAKAWRVDEWRGAIVQIASGTGAGQLRRVKSNTATVLTIDPLVGDSYEGPWATNPDATSVYALHRARYSAAWTATAGLEGTSVVGRVAAVTASGAAEKTAHAAMEE